MAPYLGVEARGGSSVSLSRCHISGNNRSGVFVQAFSRGFLDRCDIVGNAFAGVEAMRYEWHRYSALQCLASFRTALTGWRADWLAC